MESMALLISILGGVSAFLFLVVFASFRYQNSVVTARAMGQKRDQGWLFHDFYLKVYSAFFGNADEDVVAVKWGIEIEKYYKSCEVTKTQPNAKKLIVYHIYGIGCILIGLILTLLVHYAFLFIGGILLVFFCFYEQKKIDKKADEMRMQLENEFPQFLDLLIPSLQIGLPPEVAINLLCAKSDTLIAREFADAMQETKLGASGWTQAIEKIAYKYNIESLNDFVMDITNAYKKGVSVTKTVERKAQEIRKINILSLKEKAAKTTNSIIFPIMALQFVPMVIYIMFPMVMEAMVGMF